MSKSSVISSLAADMQMLTTEDLHLVAIAIYELLRIQAKQEE